MCNKAIDDFLPALKFVPYWFVTSKMIKKLLMQMITYSYMQMITYSILMKILVMLYFLVIKRVFLV